MRHEWLAGATRISDPTTVEARFRECVLRIFQPGVRVRYIPGHAHNDANHPDCEDGTVSSVNEKYVFVRFDQAVSRFGWDGATSQSCNPLDLTLL